MCMVGDEDWWDWFHASTPRARTPRTCGECGRTIARREMYAKEGGVHDGSFEWHTTCMHCDAASRWLVSVCDGYIYGRRLEDFMEHVVGGERYIRSRPLVRLVRWMRAGWADRDGILRPVEHVEVLAGIAVAAYRSQRRQQGLVAW